MTDPQESKTSSKGRFSGQRLFGLSLIDDLSLHVDLRDRAVVALSCQANVVQAQQQGRFDADLRIANLFADGGILQPNAATVQAAIDLQDVPTAPRSIDSPGRPV